MVFRPGGVVVAVVDVLVKDFLSVGIIEKLPKEVYAKEEMKKNKKNDDDEERRRW